MAIVDLQIVSRLLVDTASENGSEDLESEYGNSECTYSLRTSNIVS